MKKKKFDLERTLYAVLAIGCFFLLWWFLTTFTAVKETTPGPVAVLKLLGESFLKPIGGKVITGHLLTSLRRVLVGFSVATLIGIILGIAMGTSRWAEAIIKPIFELLRPIPPIAWISLVILPSCTPQIFAGMQVALSTSWMAVLAAEMVGAQEGCGWMIQRGSDTLNITLVMVGMIVIGIVGMLLAALMRTIERRLCSWNIMEE